VIAVVCAAAVVVAATEVGAVGDVLTKELVGRPISVSSPLGRRQCLEVDVSPYYICKDRLGNRETEEDGEGRLTQHPRASDSRSE
jgi:hypothetical protein